MKKLIAFIIAIIIAVPSFSQIKMGIKAGLSTTSIAMSDVKTISTSSTYTIDALEQANYGFHAGLFLRMTVLGIYLQPEVVFASTENQYNVTNVTAGTPAVLKNPKIQ